MPTIVFGFAVSVICVSALLSDLVHTQCHSHVSSSNNRASSQECVNNKRPDKEEYDSIKFLHNQLDDDANGDIDVTETAEFLRDELQYANGNERRKGFHRNDKHISLSELWQSWMSSEVHNWTIDVTINWLKTSVELPQYAQAFQDNGVNGSWLPQLATNNAQFITNKLKIKDPIHRQKIVLKAMDVVLFGPAKADRNIIKDTILVFLFVIAAGGCFFAYVQHRYSQNHLKKMMADMEALQKAEDSLQDLQQELDKARQEQSTVADEKRKLEKRLKHETSKDSIGIISEDQRHVQIRILEDQKEQLQNELERAERMLKQQQSHWTAPPTLQLWLQLTYEIEYKNFTAKRNAAEQQLMIARDGCEKLKKKKAQMFGSLRIAHSNSIDDIDHIIVEAKSALSEVTQELRERAKRWKQIETICGFSITKNPGLTYLQSMMHGNLNSLNVFNSARAILANKENSENTLEDESSAVQRLVSMSASLFLAPVPTEDIKRFAAAQLYNQGNGSLPIFNNKPAHLKTSRSSSHIKTNGETVI
ncbi:Stromal interaction molecule [Nymphon striatum]|nr:Stromal interaction molecule [Nymphon striatum]